MKYSDFKDIEIVVPKNVCPVSGDTFMVAKYAQSLPAQKCIEIGSGSGFVAVYLAKCGFEVYASDIHSVAVATVAENAKRNNVSVQVVESNLFDAISGTYELIIFNPPYGTASNKKFVFLIEFIKGLIPRNNTLIAKITFKMIKKQRERLLQTFLQQAAQHVQGARTILLVLHESELALLKDKNYTVVDSWKDMRLTTFSL